MATAKIMALDDLKSEKNGLSGGPYCLPILQEIVVQVATAKIMALHVIRHNSLTASTGNTN